MFQKKRLSNYGLWIAVAAFILLLLQTFGVEIAPDRFYELVNGLLGILVLLGVISNPTNPDGKYFNL